MTAATGFRQILNRAICLLAGLLLTALFAACSTSLIPASPNSAKIGNNASGDTTSPTAALKKQSKTVRVALLLPLSGFSQSAIAAKGMKQGAELALFELDQPNVELIVKNDGGTEASSRQAAQEAINEGAEIILGPLLSSSVRGAAAVAQPAGIPVIAFSNNAQIAGNGIYLMSYLPKPEVERIVSFAAKRGKRRFAALIPRDAYGDAIEPVFKQAVARAGGSIEILERYSTRANDMLDAANRTVDQIKQRNFEGAPIDALFLPGGQGVLPRIGPLIAFSGIGGQQVKLLGTGAWEFPNIGREKAFIGGWYPSPDPSGWRSFSARFAKTFGNAPPRLASLSYDAMSLAIRLSQLPKGQRYNTANLTNSNGFRGIDGVVRLTQNGLSERALAILEVQSFGSQVIENAPSSLVRTELASPH